MKTLLFFLLFSNVIFSQIINIPDANFKAKLLQADVTVGIAWSSLTTNPTTRVRIDTNNNGEIEVAEALTIRALTLTNSTIANLTGIEYFTNLGSLWVDFNQLTSINVSALAQLERLEIYNNQISTLNVSSLFLLRRLGIGNNPITSIDLSNNSNLELLWCRNNPNLTYINLKNNSNQNFSIPNGTFSDCWYFVPNLTTICADSSEITALQQFLTTCNNSASINITTNCLLDTENFEKENFKVYPNPTSGILHIESIESIESVEVYDAQLRLMKKISVLTKNTLLDISDLKTGCYFVKIFSNAGSSLKKVLKK